jgi:transglutaminase-like putative cysteine protease
MAIRFRIVHHTEYRYGSTVTSGYTIARLTPRALPHQQVHHSTVVTEPPPDTVRVHEDGFGNTVTYIGLERPHDHLVVTAESEITLVEPVWPSGGPAWDEVPGLLGLDADGLLARACALGSPLASPSDALRAYAEPSFPPGRPVDEAAGDLSARIHRDFAFDPEFSEVQTPLAEVLAHRRGVCQDFAHLLVACMRSFGLPARYVSGYLETAPPPGQPRLVGSDASHAWCSVYVPEQGWLDLDPTNDHLRPDRHVTVAWGRDYDDVAPVRGVVYGPPTPQTLHVSVDVART